MKEVGKMAKSLNEWLNKWVSSGSGWQNLGRLHTWTCLALFQNKQCVPNQFAYFPWVFLCSHCIIEKQAGALYAPMCLMHMHAGLTPQWSGISVTSAGKGVADEMSHRQMHTNTFLKSGMTEWRLPVTNSAAEDRTLSPRHVDAAGFVRHVRLTNISEALSRLDSFSFWQWK